MEPPPSLLPGCKLLVFFGLRWAVRFIFLIANGLRLTISKKKTYGRLSASTTFATMAREVGHTVFAVPSFYFFF